MKLYFLKPYFTKQYFTKPYFPKPYFPKPQFQKPYFQKLYLPKPHFLDGRMESEFQLPLWMFDIQAFIWVIFPRTGKMSKNLKRFCPVESKNTFVLVLAIFLFLKKLCFCNQKILANKGKSSEFNPQHHEHVYL